MHLSEKTKDELEVASDSRTLEYVEITECYLPHICSGQQMRVLSDRY
jgi:hypothetical protein